MAIAAIGVMLNPALAAAKPKQLPPPPELPILPYLLHAPELQGVPDTVRILLLGLDYRKYQTRARADAIHVFELEPRKGSVVVYSIERSHKVEMPADAHPETNPDQITHAYAYGGRALMKRMVEATFGRPIDYVIEANFSQAMAVLDFMGLDKTRTLAALRARKMFTWGDRQRAMNQSEFFRSMIFKYASRTEGVAGKALLYTVHSLLDTDLPADLLDKLAWAYRTSGLDHHRGRYTLQILPGNWVPETGFGDNIEALYALSEEFLDDFPDNLTPTESMASFLLRAHKQATALLGKKDWAAIGKLQGFYSKRLWHQIKEPPERERVHYLLTEALAQAYRNVGKPDKAAAILLTYNREHYYLLLDTGAPQGPRTAPAYSVLTTGAP